MWKDRLGTINYVQPEITMKELAYYFLEILSIILLALGFVIFANYLESENVQPGIHLTESEISYINKELNRRCSGDCILEPTSYGWKCTNKESKVFKIKRRNYERTLER